MPVRRGDQALFDPLEIHAPDVPRETELLKRPDAVPVHVDFIPLQSVAR